MAAFGGIGVGLQGEPLTEYAFLAALVALLPDLDQDEREARSPYGHSVGYGIVYVLLSLSGLSFVQMLGLITSTAAVSLGLAIGVGLGSHLLLDALVAPGIFSFPRGGEWDRLSLSGKVVVKKIDLLVSSLSAAFLLSLLVLF